MITRRRTLSIVGATVWGLALAAGVVSAADPTPPPPGPPFPEPIENQAVYDYAGILDGS